LRLIAPRFRFFDALLPRRLRMLPAAAADTTATLAATLLEKLFGV